MPNDAIAAATTSVAADPADPSRLRAEDVAAYERDGYVVLRGFADVATVAALRAEVEGLMRAVGLAAGTALRQTGDYAAGSALDRWINSAGLRAVAARLLGGPSTLYMPFTAVKAPGGGAFSFHQDNQYTRHDGPSCNLWLALSAMGEREGTLRVLPGSHRAGTLESVDVETDGSRHRMVRTPVERFTTLDLAPGDLVAFTRLTVHGSGANLTDAPRLAYAVQFHRDDVRAFFDDRWELLTARPRFRTGPTASAPQGERREGH